MPYLFSTPVCKYSRNYATWREGFTKEELAEIIKLGGSFPLKKGEISSEVTGEELKLQRDNYISWIPLVDYSAWLYKKLTNIVIELNDKHFGFDLTGFTEDMQYTVYDSNNGPEHYSWHVDGTSKGSCPRKLSLTLQLSDPMEYEGGEVWLHGLTREVFPKEQGTVIIFPSYALHKVTPITSGVRRSLVAWVNGPEFR